MPSGNCRWAGRSSIALLHPDVTLPMSEQNKQVVLKFIHAMGSSDVDTAAGCLSPDVVTISKGFSKFAGTHRYEAMVGMIQGFKKVLPTGLRPTVHSVTAEGQRVVVEYEGNAVTSQGKPYCNQYCMIFTLSDGKISQIHEYLCTKLADEVLYPVVAALRQTP
jgi:ketosteroid isomerase-like protein